MRPHNTKKLLRLFPRLYSSYGKDFLGFECEDGWYSLIYELSKDLELLYKRLPFIKQGPGLYTASRVHARSGQLFFYLSYETLEMAKTIVKVQKKSSKICEFCGGLGSSLKDHDKLKTVCYLHAKEIEAAAKLLNVSF